MSVENLNKSQEKLFRMRNKIFGKTPGEQLKLEKKRFVERINRNKELKLEKEEKLRMRGEIKGQGKLF